MTSSNDNFEDFSGTKLALICGKDLLVYLRDEKSGIPFPGYWDLAGGGREGEETPEQCAIRETLEEFNLNIFETRIVWKRRYSGKPKPHYFMVANIEASEVDEIQFGDEGQYWQLMPLDEFISHPMAVPHLKDRLGHYLTESAEPKA